MAVECDTCQIMGIDPKCECQQKKEEPVGPPDLDEAIRNLQNQLSGIFAGTKPAKKESIWSDWQRGYFTGLGFGLAVAIMVGVAAVTILT